MACHPRPGGFLRVMLQLGLYRSVWPMLPQGVIVMSQPGYCLGLCLVTMARVRVNVCGSCYPWGLVRCPGSHQSPEIMLVSEGLFFTRAVLIWVTCAAPGPWWCPDPRYCQRPCLGLWVSLQLESVLTFRACVTTGSHRNHACWNLRAMQRWPSPHWP